MAINFFGQFLIKKKIISKLDLLRAIELQEKKNLRFGDLVTKIGLMTKEQASRTLAAQRHEDLLFGDMAIKMGFLSPAQVQQVLDIQRREHIFIGEALVKFGIIDENQLERYLAEFKQSQKTKTTDKISIPTGISNLPIWDIVIDMTCKMLTRVAGVTFQTGACTITKIIPPHPLAIEMNITNKVSASLIITTSTKINKLLAKAILKGNRVATGTTEDIEEAVIKFANIICGNIVSKSAQLGNDLTISQAQIFQRDNEERAIPNGQTGLLLPFHFSNGEKFNLIILI